MQYVEVLIADRDLSGFTLGEFILRERIGEAGSGAGAVYRGEQLLLGREVVVNVWHQRRDDESRERFLCEARLASRLQHPFAAHIYAFGVKDQDEDILLWIATELVHGMTGITLKHWLDTHGPMPLEQFVPFFESIAQAVQAAHDRGIVHRALSSSNVMVIEGAGHRVPKVLDFGIGRLTRRDIGTGSPAYMAPEQWSSPFTVGPAVDIYALGVLAYEALTGRLPFVADTLDERDQHHRDAPVPSPGGSFSPDLDRILQRAFAKFPADRHANVLELAAALREALRASPREQLRSAAQRWADQARAPGLLWGRDMLAAFARWTLVPSGGLSERECTYLATSQRRARRSVWVRRWLGALAATVVVGVFLYRAAMQTQLAQEQTRAAQQVAEATIMQAELEQGRSALLHGEPEAQLHLGRAYHRGDHSPSTMFMFARALQPKLAVQARFASSFGRMWSAAFSPDGRQIVTTDDRAAQVRDAQTYRMLFVLPHGHEVYQAVYSANGARLVTVAADAVRIWDATSGALVHKLMQKSNDGTPSDYFVVAISFDGRFVAAIDAAGSVAHVWDATTGAPLAALRNDPLEFPGLAFSSDGRWLATTGGKDVRVFDTQTWRPACAIRGPRIHRLAFDPTSARLVTGAATGNVAIWAIPSGVRIQHLREIGDPVDAVAFSPDGQLVVAASRDGAAQVWQAGSGELQSQFNPRHSKILAVEFDRTSKLVLAAGADGTVVVADAVLGMPVTVLEGPQDIVWVAHFDPSSRRVVGASRDGTARVWDATSPYRRWGSPPVSDDCGRGTSPEPDGRFIAVGCRDHPTRVWDTSRDLLLAELPSVSHVEGDFTSASPAMSAAGDRAAIARGNTVEVYELPGGRLFRTIAHGAPVNAVAFARTGRDIISGAVDGSLLVTRDNGALLALPTSAGGIDAVGFLPDGRVVASDAQRRLRVYAPGGAVLADLEIPVRVISLRIDGARLVTVPIVPSTANMAPPVLLDLERYRVITQLEGHVGRVFSARWVAGHQILTAGVDGTARLWDGATGQLRRIYQGGSRFLADATLTPDGMVMAGGADGLLRFWDHASGRLLWALQAHKSWLIGVHVEGRDIVTRGFSGELSRWTLPSSEQVIGACGDQERCAIMRP
jgi:WD40 repeat protein